MHNYNQFSEKIFTSGRLIFEKGKPGSSASKYYEKGETLDKLEGRRDEVMEESKTHLGDVENDFLSDMVRPEERKFTELSQAAWRGSIEEVRKLMDNGANLDELDDYGLNPLHRAIIMGNEEVVRVLIEGGANIREENQYGLTPFELAEHYNMPRISEILQEGRKFTELSRAAWDGDVEEMSRLIANGANLDELDDYGLNPLHRAVIAGKEEVVRILIEGGADIEMKNQYGLTPLELAEHYNRPWISDLLIGE